MTFRILTSLIILTLCSQGWALTYQEFLDMDKAKREKMAKRYVKADGRYQTLNIKTYAVNADTGPDHALEMAVMMDDFYNSFSGVFKGGFKKKSKPQLFVLGTKQSYAQSLGSYAGINAGWSAGMFVRHGSKQALFADRSYGDDKLREILFHEGTHQLLWSFIGKDIPIWFNEGTATNFETWVMTRSRQNNIANAIHTSDRAVHVAKIYPNRGYVPFAQLAHVTHSMWLGSSRPGENYASAWAVVNYMLSTKGGQNAFAQIVKLLRSGKKHEKIFTDKLVYKIDADVKSHIEGTVIPHVNYVRPLNKLIADGRFDQARQGIEKFKQDHPKNQDAVFYGYYVDAMEGKATKASVSAVKAMASKGYMHPELNFVLAKSYAVLGDKFNMGRYKKEAIKDNGQNEAALALELAPKK